MSKTLLITFIVFVVASQAAFGHYAIPMAEQNLANAILKSSLSMANYPQRSTECFTYYLPKINEATNKYQLEYTQCLQTAAYATQAVEAEVAADRANVHYGADGVCALFQDCSTKVSSADFFECYLDAGGQAITTSYEIQTVSKTKMQYINQKYQIISYDQKTCTDASSDAYLQETTALYAELEACLDGEGITHTTTSAVYSTSTGYSTTVLI